MSRKPKKENQIKFGALETGNKKAKKALDATSSLAAISSLRCFNICLLSDPPEFHACFSCKISSVHHMCTIVEFNLDATMNSFCSQDCLDIFKAHNHFIYRSIYDTMG